MPRFTTPPPAVAVVNGVTYAVADWELRGPPVEYVRSLWATLPNPRWSVVDSNGHEHRWALTDPDEYYRPEALPTLVGRSEHVPCDGSCGGCEGYDVTVWYCATCGEKVKPGYVPDVQAMTTGTPIQVGPPEMWFTANGEAPRGQGRLSATLTVGDRSWTGEGSVVERRWSSEGASFDVEAAVVRGLPS